jgi:ribosomal protein S18 acetylase RimI-like enzyme
MLREGSTYTTKELSPRTWPDFVRLFSQKNGWDHCWCMHFHRPRGLPKDQHLHTRVERAARNRRQKKALVDRGCARGILVYSEGEPVGWCQYGLSCELPRIDSSRRYRSIVSKDRPREKQPQEGQRLHAASLENPDRKIHGLQRGAEVPSRLWRITCFVVDKRYRRRGVASSALKAALNAIKRNGGGLVEAYPIVCWEPRTFGNESTNGTVSMFRKQGFKIVASFNSTRFSTHVLMRKII